MSTTISYFEPLFGNASDGKVVFSEDYNKVLFANKTFLKWTDLQKIDQNNKHLKLLKELGINDKRKGKLDLGKSKGLQQQKYTIDEVKIEGKTYNIFTILPTSQKPALKEHLNKLSMVVEQNPATVVTFDKGGEIDYVNSKFLETTGLQQQDLLGKNIEDVIKLINSKFKDIFDTISKYGEWTGELMMSFEKRLVVEKATIKSIVNTDGEVEGYLKVGEDITNLRNTEQRLSLFLKNIDEAIYTIAYTQNKVSAITFISPQIEHFIGVPSSEINFETFQPSDYYHPEDKERVKDFVKQVNSSLEGGKCQYRSFNTKRREYLWVEVSLYPQLDHNGNHYASFGIMRDISTQIEAEDLLRQSELKHRMLFNKANDAILIIQDYRVVDCNEKTLQMFKANGFNQIVGQPLYQLMPEMQKNGEDSILNYHYFIQNALEGNSNFFKWQHSKLDGTHFDTEVSLSGFSIDNDEFVQIIVRDITRRQKAEAEKNKSIISYFELFNSSSDLIFILENTGKIIDLNETVINKYSNSKTGLVGKSIGDLATNSKQKDNILEQITKSIKSGYQKFDWWTANPQGEFPLEMVMRPGSYFGKEVIIASGRDISERIKYQTSIKESEQRFKLLSEATFEGIALTRKSEIIDVNDRFLELYGYKKRSEIIGKTIFELSDVQHHDKIRERLEEDKNEPHEFVNYKKDGTKFIVESRAENIPYNGSTIRVHVVNDITLRKQAEQERIRAELAEKSARILKKEIDERKKAERKLLAAQQYSRNIIDSSIDMIISCDKEGNIIEFNKAAENVFGYTPKELNAININNLFLKPDDAGKILRQIIDHDIYSGEINAVKKGGSQFDLYLSAGKLKNSEGETMGTMAIARDVTHVKETAGKLRENIRQKEVLIKEVHHRVKNNLQVISSILNLQSSYVDDEQTLTILQECQDRIKSMAFIHESLYQSEDLAKVEFTEYLENLCNNLLFSYISKERTVKIDFDLEPTFLTLDTAIPCGLIVNELVSNSLKYAFKDREQGNIKVSLSKKGNQKLLIVKDNGVGLPDNIDYRNTESLGLQLVVTLVEQVEGKIEYSYKDGAEFVINFEQA